MLSAHVDTSTGPWDSFAAAVIPRADRPEMPDEQPEPGRAKELPMYPLRMIHDLRPALSWTIYALPIDIPSGSEPQIHERRIAVRWDEDNDERVLGAVLDVYFRRPESVWHLFAAGESKAKLTVWASLFGAEDRTAWREAASSHVIMDAWDIAFVDGMDEMMKAGGKETLRRNKEGRSLRFPPEYSDVNALIDLFGLGPSAPRREWKW